MDLLASKSIYQAIRTVDRAGSQALEDAVNDLELRNPDDLDGIMNGANTSGKMIIRIKYKILQGQQIQRLMTVSFVTNTGETIAAQSTAIVEKVS